MGLVQIKYCSKSELDEVQKTHLALTYIFSRSVTWSILKFSIRWMMHFRSSGLMMILLSHV